ncbi:hypothetical protein [Paenibacillus sp. YIM B09110]|uniref:hypothetical protein n=1 Tax=Paenibacillus sp. YIM B09110 TaxID=3126102 RepID=UPI00301D265E
MNGFWSMLKNWNWNVILTLLFTLALVIIAVKQYYITVEQTEIADKQTEIADKQTKIASDANKLAQYEYRFQFYNDLETLIEQNSVIEKEPQLEADEYIEMNFEIVSLLRESRLLFDGKTSKMLNDVLEKHLLFLIEMHEVGMLYDKYEERKRSLLEEYAAVLSSPDLAEYLDINKIN